ASLDAAIDAARPVEQADVTAADLYGIFYTGGTTAASKGVMLSHGNIVANQMNMLAEIPFSAKTAYLHAAPMFHAADCAATFGVTASGGMHTFVPRFDAVPVMRTIQQFGVSHPILVPSMINMLVSAPTIGDHDRSTLQLILYGGSPISDALLRRAMQALPQTGFLQAYGMTELAPVASFLSASAHVTDGPHVGRLRSGGRAAVTAEIRIVDDQDREVPRGTVGQIAVRGPMVMQGYWNQPKLTADALRGGWMHTGDGGYMDDDGFVYVVDRIKDMIITG